MTFKTQLALDLPAVFYNTDEGAETGTYTPRGGDPVPGITVNFGYGADDKAEGADVSGVTGQVRIQVSDVAVVAAGDAITLDSGTWEIVDPTLGPDGLEWRAEVQKR